MCSMPILTGQMAMKDRLKKSSVSHDRHLLVLGHRIEQAIDRGQSPLRNLIKRFTRPTHRDGSRSYCLFEGLTIAGLNLGKTPPFPLSHVDLDELISQLDIVSKRSGGLSGAS